MDSSWDDHRYFLAIARAGSLSSAAKTLSVSQPTVSRRLVAMEKSRGVRLFRRTRNGYELTPSGADLLQTVLLVEEELLKADRKISGRDQELSGALRFTCTEVFLNGYLGPFLWEFLREHSDIDLQLVCTQSRLSLSRGEADIALRFTDSPPENLVGRRLGTVAYGIYGAANQPGQRLTPSDPADTNWIGLHDERFNRMLYGTFMPNTRLKHRVDNMAAMQAMVRAGLGASILPCYTADPDPQVRRLLDQPLRHPRFDIWMLYHPDARRTRRLRVFADFLVARLKADTDLFDGRRLARQAAPPVAR